jgi:hypothetical protein
MIQPIYFSYFSYLRDNIHPFVNFAILKHANTETARTFREKHPFFHPLPASGTGADRQSRGR